MDADTYWAIVEQTRPRGNDPDAHCRALTRRLRRLPPAEIVGYERVFLGLVDAAYRADLWDVASQINGWCSDDGFVYFRRWLAHQGRDVYELALADPESLVELWDGRADLEHELYGCVALDAYQAVTGEDDFPSDLYAGLAGGAPRLRGRFVTTGRGLRRKYPMVWRLTRDRPPADPAWLRCNDGALAGLARSIHAGRRWADLPVLADALQEAGCDDPFILDHLRAGRPHARHCWVTNLLLERPSRATRSGS